MLQRFSNMYYLGKKELTSLRSDAVMVILIVFAFTVFIIVPSKNAALDTRNASVAVVDEDHSTLSRQLQSALLEPYFKVPATIEFSSIDQLMAGGKYTFVLHIPHRFEAKLLAGKEPALNLLVDATAMSQAGNGAHYIQRITQHTIKQSLRSTRIPPTPPIDLNIRIAYNPNLYGTWFFAVIQMINVVAMLAIVLTGAALIRERERGTIEHLLVLPLKPVEIAMAKVCANGAVIIIAMLVSLAVVVRGVLEVPLHGSMPLFLFGTALYIYAVATIGIFLGTVARSMPQLGLLFLPIVMVIMVLSGGITPLGAMPPLIQKLMTLAPSTHFTEFATAVLFRDASWHLVWTDLLAMSLIGLAFFIGALLLFRQSVNRITGQ